MRKREKKPLSWRAYLAPASHHSTQSVLQNYFPPESPMELKDGTKVRKDAVKQDGTAVIIKPNTTTGRRSAAKREKLMNDNGHKTEVKWYDPTNPAYQPGSPTYIGPKQ